MELVEDAVQVLDDPVVALEICEAAIAAIISRLQRNRWRTAACCRLHQVWRLAHHWPVASIYGLVLTPQIGMMLTRLEPVLKAIRDLFGGYCDTF